VATEMQAGTEVVSRRSRNDCDEGFGFGFRLGFGLVMQGAFRIAFPASQTNYDHDLTGKLFEEKELLLPVRR